MFPLILQNNTLRFHGFQIAEVSKLANSRGTALTKIGEIIQNVII